MASAPVDLRSDTKTRPTPAMRAAIAEAAVGDEQAGEDPTTTSLERRAAALLGKEAAVFTPSGTMCNAIAFCLHLRPGDEVVLDRNSHPVRFEVGGPSALAGGLVAPIDTEGGIFDGEALRRAIHPNPDQHSPRSRLVSVEQTTNIGGGRVWPLAVIDEVVAVAREHGLSTHMDGARLLNAVVASGVSAARFAEGFDTVWLDFSKGLGAPIGAALAGSAELVAEARRVKQMLGGSMRQSGIVAAAALYALDHHVERLAEDHEHARLLADGLAKAEGVALDPSLVETNIVVFTVRDAHGFCDRLAGEGVLMGAVDDERVRAVTHLDVDRAGVERAVSAVSALGWR
ncbi:MAG TPA: threonine aldolase family protein [Acidimicrobiales bacterium]|nr:threonine aldolase family protein [Acidimicrobiales bacterium]